MHWKAKYTRVNYQDGATRLKRCFAWIPVYINGCIHWLESYEVLQVYNVFNKTVMIDEEPKKFIIGKWENLSKRLCK